MRSREREMEQVYSCDRVPGMEIPRKAFAGARSAQWLLTPRSVGPVSTRAPRRAGG